MKVLVTGGTGFIASWIRRDSSSRALMFPSLLAT